MFYVEDWLLLTYFPHFFYDSGSDRKNQRLCYVKEVEYRVWILEVIFKGYLWNTDNGKDQTYITWKNETGNQQGPLYSGFDSTFTYGGTFVGRTPQNGRKINRIDWELEYLL